MDRNISEGETNQRKQSIEKNTYHLSPSAKITSTNTTSLVFSDVMATMISLKSEEFSRMTGIIAHLSYWQVFGSINSIQPDDQTKKQMIVACYDQLHILRRKSKVVL